MQSTAGSVVRRLTLGLAVGLGPDGALVVGAFLGTGRLTHSNKVLSWIAVHTFERIPTQSQLGESMRGDRFPLRPKSAPRAGKPVGRKGEADILGGQPSAYEKR